ncbi:DUF4321 domain-containing protein [Abyssisolibacter fermentans]|uniref:DUF4321 domain-containing protein n=1 Tax=Abyssisolibacter fermentans TaxID=1766203 RepID=UPI00082D6CF0|nr:DUF4321 domain-containing protein [Abyssisolibacter fermentans]
MKSRNRNTGVLIILLIVGLIIGGVIGDFFSDKIEILGRNYSVGLKTPLVLDLKVIKLTFGMLVSINLASIIGIVIAILVYRKL